MKPIHCFLLPVVFLFSIFNPAKSQKPVTIVGTVLEAEGKQPIPFATVAVKEQDGDALITGVTTDLEGRFTITVASEAIYLEISFLGFKTTEFREITFENGKANLGDILLQENKELLNEIVVEEERSRTEFRVDKKVFNVGTDLSSTGMGALEVLSNVPSVNVNIEGEISLRGASGVQILVNGKPLMLGDEQSKALGTITADMIEKIEVITNPSAKYDAEGTAGILNIVLKKEEKKGINGSISLNTGWPENHSVGISLNRRTEKFNLFTQLGAGYRSLPRYSESRNFDSLSQVAINSEGVSYRDETFYNVVLGTDYHINDRNVLTLSGRFAYEIEDQPSFTEFDLYDADGVLSAEWNRTEVTDATNPKWQYDLQYTKEFKNNKDHKLLMSGQGSFFGKDQASEFENEAVSGVVPIRNQQTRANFQQMDQIFKLDYTNPLSKVVTIETGAQYVINQVGNDYAVSDWVDGAWIIDPSFTNNFEFDQAVFGAYGTAQYEKKKWGVKGGLRVENTELNTLLTNTGQDNHQNYTNLFPSFHTSYKISKVFSVMAGYSRRIYRPRLWDLNPFFNIRNNFNIRTGNPNLQPELTNSYEVTGIAFFKKLVLNTAIYHRHTTDVIERVSFFENSVNTTTPVNIGINNTLGIEANASYKVSKALSFNGDFNYGIFQRKGTFNDQVFDFNGNKWSSKLVTRLKLKSEIDFELSGNYESGFETVQTTVSQNAFMNIGIRKKLLDNKLVVSLGIRDVFASRIQESFAAQDNFYLYNFSQRGRFLTFGLSYGIGKGETMTYSGGRRR